MQLEIGSIKIERRQGDLHSYVLCDTKGKELWESADFILLEGETARMVFHENAIINVPIQEK